MRTERTTTPWLAAALLAALAALPSPAAAADVVVSGHFFWGAGYRHSFSNDLGGLDLRVGVGVGLGPLALEINSEHATDHSFKAADRVAGRGTNWLAASVRIPLPGPLALAIGGGPGVGWIKPPGKPSAPHRSTVLGLHEFLRIDIGGGRDVPLRFSIHIEPQHQWQDALLPGVDHSLAVWMSMGLVVSDS